MCSEIIYGLSKKKEIEKRRVNFHLVFLSYDCLFFLEGERQGGEKERKIGIEEEREGYTER